MAPKSPKLARSLGPAFEEIEEAYKKHEQESFGRHISGAGEVGIGNLCTPHTPMPNNVPTRQAQRLIAEVKEELKKTRSTERGG